MPLRSRWSTQVPSCSLQQWLFGSSQAKLSDNKTIIDADRPDTHYLTMAEYRLLAKRIAIGFQDAGLKPGDRVLMISGNSIWFPAVFLGVLMAGGIFTGANPTFVARELAYQLKDSGAKFMFTAPFALETALEAAKEVNMAPSSVFYFDPEVNAKLPSPTLADHDKSTGTRPWTDLLQNTASRAETWDWVEPTDPSTTSCCLNYSSGTTGVPKGVEITHSAYVANCDGVVYLDNKNPRTLERKAEGKQHTVLCFLPMYHAMAQTYFIANYPRTGAAVYVMPYFDFVKMLEHVQNYRISNLVLVPPIVVALAKHPAVREYDLSSVEGIGCGAAPLSKEAQEECEGLWKSGDVLIRQGWGMTEVTCTCLSWDPSGEPIRSSGVGELMPNCSARLVEIDGSNREITEPNRRGELWVSGPTLMRRYWQNPKATAETIFVDPKDGMRWLRTGDIAYIEGTYATGSIFHVVDRIKELIKVKGNQVAPAELENVLLERPEVKDVGVVGVTIKGEEVPRAYLVVDDDSKVTPDDIAKWFAGKVARYKQLKGGVVFVDEIPKNPSGKILRKLLREKAKEEVGDKDKPASKLA